MLDWDRTSAFAHAVEQRRDHPAREAAAPGSVQRITKVPARIADEFWPGATRTRVSSLTSVVTREEAYGRG